MVTAYDFTTCLGEKVKKKKNIPKNQTWIQYVGTDGWREQLADRKSFSSMSHLHQDQGCGPPNGGGGISYSLALASPLSAVPCSCNCPAAVGNALRASYSHAVCAECKYGNRAGISVRFGLCSFIARSTSWRTFLTKTGRELRDQLELHTNHHQNTISLQLEDSKTAYR